jgi:hypothetical protein
MDRKTIETLLRATLQIIGSYIMAKNILGSSVDAVMWEMIVGGIMSVMSIVWGVLDKNVGIEMLQSTIRNVFVAFGGVLVAQGKLSSEKLETYIGFAITILPVVYSILSRKKSQAVVTGGIEHNALKI